MLGPGPDDLGRGLVIVAGAHVPAAWQSAPHVVVDQAVVGSPHEIVLELTRLASDSRRVVVELSREIAAAFAAHPRTTTTAAPFELGPRFSFTADVLHHLVWSNSIDGTGPEPRWWLLEAALALGASCVDDGIGDIVLPGGSRAWLLGGAARRFDPILGVDVLHAVAVEHGSLSVPLLSAAAIDMAIDLAPDQLAAVIHTGSAARIIAPAGSGKTRVLTERARHLVTCWRLPSTAVSLVAFNKRAQEEMQARAGDLRGLRVRTLNAIALAIVNGNAPFRAQPRTLRTIDEIDVRRIIGRLVQFPRKRNTDPAATWIEALSVIRLGLRKPSDVEAMYDGDVLGLAEMWPRYRAVLDSEGVLDFDQQIYRAIELLLTDADIRLAAQRSCRLLLVDEFQDLTPAHVLLVRLLSEPGFGVFGVGDDDQTIYGFSGADPAWLIDFASLFPSAEPHPLEVNYRCPGDVVQAADRLVRHNRRRVPKVIRASKENGSGLQVVANDNTLAATVTAVRDAIEAGTSPADIAVLTRVNALLTPVQVALHSLGIPVQGGVGVEFLERTAIRAALAWLRLSVAAHDRLDPDDLTESLRRPSRPLHPNVAAWVAEQRSLAGLHRLAGRVNVDRDAQRITSFADDIARLQDTARSADVAAVLRSLGDDVGLGASIATLDDGRRGMNRSAQNDDLVALTQIATLQPDPAKFGDWLRDQLAIPRNGSGVTLATTHRVKGQEWPVVVIHHAEADQFPHRLAEDHEEERRVFHVALTRCSRHVTVVVGANPSPFVDEMQHEPPAVLPSEPLLPRVLATSPTRAESARDSAFPKGSVLAAVGLVIVDGGQHWTIESIEDDTELSAVVARLDKMTRRFALNAAVATLGRQRGPLRRPQAHDPSPNSIRAHDLLRQIRERLRNGKPAYVVFDDATLERIALALPTTLNALHSIRGIGPAKIEQYGDAVLLAIEDACSVVACETGGHGVT